MEHRPNARRLSRVSVVASPAARRATTAAVPFVGLLVLAAVWGRDLHPAVAVAVAVPQLSAVLVAVVHAESIAHRVGEPLGTLVLALSVTVIEVALIVTLMASEPEKSATLARDTVFAAIMIVCNGLVGAVLLLGAISRSTVLFSGPGANALLATLITLTVLSLVMPTFTSSSSGPTFTGPQLAFAAVASTVVYAVFMAVQTGRHRAMFVDDGGAEASPAAMHHDFTGERPLAITALLLLASLVAVVGLTKALSHSIDRAVVGVGAPPSVVGVVIAAMVLLPESIAALRSARRGDVQTSLNLALGSALASIGLTIPSIAVASIWLDGPIALGLGGKEIVLLSLSAVVGMLTFSSGRATVLQATHHLAVFGTFVFLSVEP